MRILNTLQLDRQENHAHKMITWRLITLSHKLIYCSALNKIRFVSILSMIMIFIPIPNICNWNRLTLSYKNVSTSPNFLDVKVMKKSTTSQKISKYSFISKMKTLIFIFTKIGILITQSSNWHFQWLTKSPMTIWIFLWNGTKCIIMIHLSSNLDGQQAYMNFTIQMMYRDQGLTE